MTPGRQGKLVYFQILGTDAVNLEQLKVPARRLLGEEECIRVGHQSKKRAGEVMGFARLDEAARAPLLELLGSPADRAADDRAARIARFRNGESTGICMRGQDKDIGV